MVDFRIHFFIWAEFASPEIGVSDRASCDTTTTAAVHLCYYSPQNDRWTFLNLNFLTIGHLCCCGFAEKMPFLGFFLNILVRYWFSENVSSSWLVDLNMLDCPSLGSDSNGSLRVRDVAKWNIKSFIKLFSHRNV